MQNIRDYLQRVSNYLPKVSNSLRKVSNCLGRISKKIKIMYSRHLIGKITLTILGLCFIILLTWFIPVMMIEKNQIIGKENSPLTSNTGDIAIEAGEVLVAESGNKQLYINSDTMNIKVKDNKTGKVWNSSLNGGTTGTETALLSITYLGEDNNLYEWNTYDNCTLLKSYSLHKITNGLQIKMHVNEGESNRFYEYMPQKLPVERYENFFITGLDNLVTEGVLEQSEADKYKLTLSLIYKRSQVEECYAVAYSGNPPSSAVAQLINVTKLLGYTTEMLKEDSEFFGLSVTFREPASFDIVLEATLEGDDFVVRIPTYEMVSGNDFYKIQNVKVLPNFGATMSTDYEDGYIFVPDGAGALFKFNTYEPAVPDYIRPVYNNDYYTDYYYKPEYGEELMMPIYGMTYGVDDGATHGFLAIIEEGAETSYINVKLASNNNETGSVFNKVYSSFDMTQYNKVKVYGPYSSDSPTYLVDTEEMDIDYKIRYKLYPEKVSYYDMAKTYQNYLLEQDSNLIKNESEGVKLYLDAIGSLTLKERFLGIPYNTTRSMTTYSELLDIIKDLGDKELIVQYSGMFNEGLNNSINKKADLVKENGSKKELKELKEYMTREDMDLFFGVSLSKVYDKGKGFSSKIHALYDYSNAAATVYRYLPSIGIFNGFVSSNANYYYTLSPRYLSGIVNDFIHHSKEYESLSIPDLAGMYYADYKFKNIVTPYEATVILKDSLEKLSNNKTLALYNPRMDNIGYGDYAVEISRESSGYSTFYTTIPFRQLVMNGLVEYTTENVNMSSKNMNYYILQSLELNSYPKFTITSKNVDILKNSDYEFYYSTQYEILKNTMNKVYEACNLARQQIGSTEIVGHRIISKQVFCTDYASGVSVITNYGLNEYIGEDYTIEPLGFKIIGGQEGEQ